MEHRPRPGLIQRFEGAGGGPVPVRWVGLTMATDGRAYDST